MLCNSCIHKNVCKHIAKDEEVNNKEILKRRLIKNGFRFNSDGYITNLNSRVFELEEIYPIFKDTMFQIYTEEETESILNDLYGYNNILNSEKQN